MDVLQACNTFAISKRHTRTLRRPFGTCVLNQWF